MVAFTIKMLTTDITSEKITHRFGLIPKRYHKAQSNIMENDTILTVHIHFSVAKRLLRETPAAAQV